LPIVWGVDHGARMVVATARGVLRMRDLENDLDGLSGAAVFSLRKIFDMGQASLDLSEADMMALGARIRDHVNAGRAGPVAVVAGADQAYSQAKQLASRIAADRLFEVFRETSAAREWLDSVTREPPSRAREPVMPHLSLTPIARTHCGETPASIGQ
jgi:hypothetical protein